MFCITSEEAEELNRELIEKDNMDNKLEWSLWTQVITVVLVILGIAI